MPKVIVNGCNNGTATTNIGHVIIQSTSWYPSGGSMPIAGSTTATILKGYQFKALDDGTVQGVSISKGQIATAWTDSPGQTMSNWDLK